VRSAISRLGPESEPSLIREVHLDLLEAFGRTIGFGFHEQRPLDSPSEDLTIVQGRFDRRAREREFGVHLFVERQDGRPALIAWVIDLYLPERCRRQGAGTVLMAALLELWERIGVTQARAITAGDGQLAFPSWGFEADPQGGQNHGLLPVRLALPRQRYDGTPRPTARESETLDVDEWA
jgi:GNAT superfamily N-acetyltransferase